MSLRGRPIPDEFYFLCMLHNLGATSSEKSLSLEEITRWTAMEPEKVRLNIQKLIETNYLKANQIKGTERYHITVNGIRKVLSMYS